MAFLAAGIVLIGGLSAYLFLFRPWQLRWGATDEEIERYMSGDEIVATPAFNATRAVTVNAPPENIAAWFQQWLNHPFREPVIVGMLAMVIGVIGGLGAIIFRFLIHVFFSLFHLPLVADSPWRAAIPALGLMLVGGITHFLPAK